MFSVIDMYCVGVYNPEQHPPAFWPPPSALNFLRGQPPPPHGLLSNPSAVLQSESFPKRCASGGVMLAKCFSAACQRRL